MTQINRERPRWRGRRPSALAVSHHGRAVAAVVSLTSFLLARALIAQTDLICTIPARLARHYSRPLHVLAPPCEVGTFSVAMGWHPRAHSDPAQQWLREQVLTAGQDGNG